MKKIEFRAWDMEKQEMIYEVDEWYNKDDYGKTKVYVEKIRPEFQTNEIRNSSYQILSYIRDDGDDSYDNIEIEKRRGWTMQFIGRRDKNNKKIYEKDIIKFEDETGIVEWSEFSCNFYIAKPDNTKILQDWGLWWRQCPDYEVIGNIHETSKLVK